MEGIGEADGSKEKIILQSAIALIEHRKSEWVAVTTAVSELGLGSNYKALKIIC